MELKGKKFLSIGGAGLIGSHTLEQLLKEDIEEVLIYDNFSRGKYENIAPYISDPRVKIFELGGDILHEDILAKAMKGRDGVFHFAALWLLHCYDFPESAFEVNIRGTFNVLQACIKNGVQRLVYSSSASVYGDAIQEPMTEDHPYNNNNFYGATKIAGEHMCRSLYHRYKETAEKFDYVGLRYMNVYGPRQDYQGAYIAVIMKMLDRIDAGLSPVIYGDGSQAYDFIYVGDCGRANVLAMKANVTDEFFNVGSGIRTTLKELASLVLKATNCNLDIEFKPSGTTFVKNRVGSPVKAKDQLGFQTTVALEDGLKKLIEWRNSHKEQVQQRKREANIADD
jgi:UDP-glucose 4-epimerase